MKKTSLRYITAICLLPSSVALYGCSGNPFISMVETKIDGEVAVEPDIKTPEKWELERVFSSAIEQRNSEYCKALIEAEDIANCKKMVSDTMQHTQAITSKNAGLCKKIYQVSIRKLCEIQIQEINNEDSKKKELAQVVIKEEKKANEAVAKRNPKACEKITTEDVRSTCFDNVYLSLAIEDKNPSYCEKLDPELRNRCLRTLE